MEMNEKQINVANLFLEQDEQKTIIKIFYNNLDTSTRTKVKEAVKDKLGLDKTDEVIDSKINDRFDELQLFDLDIEKLINSMNFQF